MGSDTVRITKAQDVPSLAELENGCINESMQYDSEQAWLLSSFDVFRTNHYFRQMRRVSHVAQCVASRLPKKPGNRVDSYDD